MTGIRDTLQAPFYTNHPLARNFTNKKTINRAFRQVRPALQNRNFEILGFYWKYCFGRSSDNWYLSLFRNQTGIKGEISPSYAILDVDDITKMHDMSPGAKLVFLVRNPVDRAWSGYKHFYKKGKIVHPDDDRDGTIAAFMHSPMQMLRSDYIRTIRNYTSVFAKDQLIIGFYDGIIDSPEQFLKEIISFISGKEDIVLAPRSRAGKVIHKGADIKCPSHIRTQLKDMYYDQIKSLATTYGGYFNKWLKDTYGEDCSTSTRELKPTIIL